MQEDVLRRRESRLRDQEVDLREREMRLREKEAQLRETELHMRKAGLEEMRASEDSDRHRAQGQSLRGEEISALNTTRQDGRERLAVNLGSVTMLADLERREKESDVSDERKRTVLWRRMMSRR